MQGATFEFEDDVTKILDPDIDRLAGRRMQFSGIEFVVLQRQRQRDRIVSCRGAWIANRRRRERRQSEQTDAAAELHAFSPVMTAIAPAAADYSMELGNRGVFVNRKAPY
jgi:hypothetical protein